MVFRSAGRYEIHGYHVSGSFAVDDAVLNAAERCFTNLSVVGDLVRYAGNDRRPVAAQAAQRQRGEGFSPGGRAGFQCVGSGFVRVH